MYSLKHLNSTKTQQRESTTYFAAVMITYVSETARGLDTRFLEHKYTNKMHERCEAGMYNAQQYIFT